MNYGELYFKYYELEKKYDSELADIKAQILDISNQEKLLGSKKAMLEEEIELYQGIEIEFNNSFNDKKIIQKNLLKLGVVIFLFIMGLFSSFGVLVELLNVADLTFKELFIGGLFFVAFADGLGLPSCYYFDTERIREIERQYSDVDFETLLNSKRQELDLINSKLTYLSQEKEKLETALVRRELLNQGLKNFLDYINECYKKAFMSTKVDLEDVKIRKIIMK